LNPASEIKNATISEWSYLGRHLTSYLNSKQERSSNFWDPVFNNYDDIPSKLAQIYQNTSSIIQHNCCYQETIKRSNRISTL
jgi:hypothetical protein